MCGICGFYFCDSGRPGTPELLTRMCGTMVHRGPDDEGTHLDGSLGIGMRRLSIIDLDTGQQPIFNEDESIAVVCNGEIYNFQELRDELEARGHCFRTRSDTEVIVHLYEEEGLDFPRRLNGMFAIALWDSRTQRLLLVRDRMGVKPLYYAWTPDGLIFGSELKALLQVDELSLEHDPEAIYHYFTLGYIPHPFTIYRNVRQLPPASRLVAAGGPPQISRYWSLESRVDWTRSRASFCEEIRALLLDATRLRLVSDVPLGAFLSGGLDSSIVVALMAKLMREPVKTFFIDFNEAAYSERPYARSVVDRYQTDHHEFVVEPSAVDVLDHLVEMFDEPFGDSSAVPTYYVSKLARQHVTVALAGDGGDEAFGGYLSYQRILRRQRVPGLIRRLARPVGNGVHRLLDPTARGRRFFRALGMQDHRYFAGGVPEVEAREMLAPELLEEFPVAATYELLRPTLESADRLDRLAPYTYLDTHYYLPDDILVKVDRMSMAHSLELRSPFLDYRVHELAATIPVEYKVSSRGGKAILKDAFRDDLPAEVLVPRKRGFSMPLDHWFRQELRTALEEALDDGELAGAGILQMDRMRQLANEHWAGVRDRRHQLWHFLFFARWWHARGAHSLA